MPAAVVVDVGWVNGLAAIRSLGRAGVPVHRGRPPRERARLPLPLRAARRLPRPGARTRTAFVALPRRRSATRSAGRRRSSRRTTTPLNAIARNRDDARRALPLPVPGLGGARAIQRKRFQLERARAAGVAVPRTLTPRSPAEALAAAARARLPGARQAVGPDRLQAARSAARRSAARPPPSSSARTPTPSRTTPMVQELIPGGDDELYTLGSYLAADGEALGLFSRPQAAPDAARRRHLPGRRGRLGRRGRRAGPRACSRALGFHGVSQVEFKRDPRDGALQADGGQPAPLAVARPRGRLRRRPARASPTGTSSATGSPPARDERRAASAGRSRCMAGTRPRARSGRPTSTPCSRSTIPSPALVQAARVVARASSR